MPRITDARRQANRAQIVAAARRCFSRDGFHQTSMPDIAAEAGIAVGAPYRYFANKEEIILEIAGAAFRVIFDPLERMLGATGEITVPDLVIASLEPLRGDVAEDASSQRILVEELLRCAVQAWAEILRNEDLHQRANASFDHVRQRIADALRRGQSTQSVPPGLDPDRGARVVMALLHGFVLQRTAFGLEDIAEFIGDIRTMLGGAGVLN